MSRDDFIVLKGIVVESLKNAMFRVKLETGVVVICHISGRLRKFSIRVLPGDGVVVEFSPYDLSKGRIIRRD